MNAAFLLVTSALLTGHHPAAASCNAPACSAPATVATACDPCQSESFGHKLRHKLQGLFQCNSCKKDACTTCAPAPAPVCAPAPAPTCAPKCAAPTSCDPCAHGGHKLLGKLKGMFNRSSDCGCEASVSAPACATGGCAPAAAGTVVTPATPAAPAGETIKDAPKKMPAAPKGDKAVQLETVPASPLSIPALNPVIDSAPTTTIIAPRTVRSPF